jgi:hypothetical protein
MQGEPDPTPYVSFCENPPSKSARGWRTPGRYRAVLWLSPSRSVPECGSPLPLWRRLRTNRCKWVRPDILIPSFFPSQD